jgi:LemA protein
MRQVISLSFGIVVLAAASTGLVRDSPAASRQGIGPKKDEVYFALARRINAQSESPVSAIVNALGEVIEVEKIEILSEGKATVVVKELTPSNARSTNKSIRLVFVPTDQKDKWLWESFEDNRKLYPVDKLFPYAKDRLTQSRQTADRAWSGFLEVMNKEGEAAVKVVTTAKAILKSDPAPLAPLTLARSGLAEAVKGKEVEAILNSHRDLVTAIEQVLALADNHPELKANDAFLRLLDELKAVQASRASMRKTYVDAVAVYNDDIRRLPFALVAYGMEFTKVDAKIQPE